MEPTANPNTGFKKTAIAGISAIAVFAAIFGFIQYDRAKNAGDGAGSNVTGSTQSGSEASVEEQETAILEAKMRNSDTYNLAVNSGDATICDQITGDDALRRECADNALLAKATASDDSAACNQITDATLKTKCTNDFAYRTAAKSGTDADCDKIQSDDSLKYSCKKNVTFQKIESDSFSGTVEDTCKGLEGNDLAYCKGRIEKHADVSTLEKAIAAMDPSMCVKMETADLKTICNDSIYLSLATGKGDASLCGKIVDATKRSQCQSALAKVADAKTLQDAIATNNIALCGKITTAELKTKCTDTLTFKDAISRTDASSCGKIADATLQSQCKSTVEGVIQSKTATSN